MQTNNALRGRFAPSPSGRMHLGNLFCALIAWLSVRSAGGVMLLRVEDLDPDRCRRDYELQLEEDLRWLGLDWDEGGLSSGGPHAPYCQSERTAQYQQAVAVLEQTGLIYPCFCSRDDLHSAAAPHRGEQSPLYARRCLSLSQQERAARSALRNPAWRLQVSDEVFTFDDGCQGSFSSNLDKSCGDFIVRRSDGVFAYQLAVVVDDAMMGVTEVVRGGDLLDSTPRQIYLYRLLGFSPPRFYHLPLLLAEDGRRLSKRDRDLDCGALRQRFSPQELLGRLAFLAGLLPAPDPVMPNELIDCFCWEKVRRKDIVVSTRLFESSRLIAP